MLAIPAAVAYSRYSTTFALLDAAWAIPVAAVASVCGLMLGVATLIVVLSVMNGFERELRSRILSVTSHATLMGLRGTLPEWRSVQKVAAKMPEVIAAVPYIESEALLTNGKGNVESPEL